MMRGNESKIDIRSKIIGTLVSDEVVAFWKDWEMGFHTSVDGIPKIQNQNRPLASGEASSPFVEDAVPKILSYRSNTTARCTVVPENVKYTLENYHYFRSLGYTKIAMVPNDGKDWNDKSILLFEEQFLKVADALIAEMRNGIFVEVKGIHEYLKSPKREKRERFQCGAGRGMVLVDVHGDLWPCHRWNKQSEGTWKIGNIYENFDDTVRQSLQNGCPDELVPNECNICEALNMCHGGCPAENLEESGSPFKMSLNKCQLTMKWAKAGKHVYDTLCNEKCPTFVKHYYSNDQ